MTRSTRVRAGWRPLLSGAAAKEAVQTVEAIAKSIASLSLDGRDFSLAGGQAGLALLYAWLAVARRNQEAHSLARQYLDEAIETSEATNTTFWGGVAGVAWATELVDRLLDPGGEDRNEAVDEALSRLLSRPRWWVAPHDLVLGATGVGIYALERNPRPSAVECLQRVVDRLEESARHDEHGIYWWTPPMALFDVREEYPSGLADLGVAHGVPGAIAMLGAIYAAGVERARVRPLLEGAVSWLMAQAIATEAGPTFPYFVAPGLEPTPARCAWCYGDPGVAAALMVAARGAGEAAWEREAVALACRAAERPATETGLVDACFCHGTAGLAHIYNRMYQATGKPELGRAARYWIERTLELCRLAEDDGGLRVEGFVDPSEEPWTGIDLTDGAAGVALVLLAATTPVDPIWDRMFLISAPGVPLLDGR